MTFSNGIATLARRRKNLSTIDVSIGNSLRAVRQRRGLTQAELAQILGINQSRISEYEQGEIRLPGDVIVKLAKALKVSSDEILGLKPTDVNAPKNGRLLRRFQRLQELPAAERRAVLKILDSLLAKASNGGS